MRAIVEGAADQDDDDARRIAALYASFMDVERVEALGVAPLRPLLDEIAAAPDRSALARVLGRRQREGRASLIGSFVSTDAKDPSRYLVHLTSPGLGLPGRVVLPRRVLRARSVRPTSPIWSGSPSWWVCPSPRSSRRPCMELETALAAASWDRVTQPRRREDLHPHDRGGAARAGARVRWDDWLDGLGAPDGAFAEVVVRQPSFVEAAAALWHGAPARPVAGVARQLRTVSACADFLSDAVVQQDFAFYGRTLSGTPQIRDRWKRGVALVEASVGEAVGRLYVDRHFPASSKERMTALVANLVEAYRQSISTLDWMGPATRERALEKLAKFTPKIGYPDKWGDYSALEVRARRPPRQRAARGRLAHRPRARQDRQAGRPRRVVHDAADRQRLLQPAAQRDRLPGRDPAAAVLRPRRRRRGQLRRHRRGDRPRDRPRLRRPGQQVRRRRHHDRLVERRRPRRVRPARPGAHRPVRRARARGPARPPGQRRADRRREHRRPRRPDDRAQGVPDRARRRRRRP